MTDVQQVVDLLAPARAVAFLTGAGMSAESGIPTFRDALTGLWAKHDPMQLATADAFRSHPHRVFGWYLSRYRSVRDAVPHAGYDAIGALARLGRAVTVVTQNVDGLHRRGGDGVEVIEVHGSLAQFRCADCAEPVDLARIDALADSDVEGNVEPPRCQGCGGLTRPGVVWFGEMLRPGDVTRAEETLGECDVLLVVGTSSLVYPAAGLPVIAQRRGVPVVEINPDPTPLSDTADICIRDSASAALSGIATRLAERLTT